METKDILEAISADPELLDAHSDNEEFRNLLTHVTQASTGDEAIRILCRGFLDTGGPLTTCPAEPAEPVNPKHD